MPYDSLTAQNFNVQDKKKNPTFTSLLAVASEKAHFFKAISDFSFSRSSRHYSQYGKCRGKKLKNTHSARIVGANHSRREITEGRH